MATYYWPPGRNSGGGGGSSAETIPILNSFAELLALGAHVEDTYFLTGYSSSYPGIGSGFWIWEPGSPLTTTTGVVAFTGGAYVPMFYNSRIDVTRFGARDGTTNNAAVQDAMALQQNAAFSGDKVLFFPQGRFIITSTLDTTASAERFQCEGIGRGEVNSLPYYSGASTVEMATDNTPVFKINKYHDSIRGMTIRYTNRQTSAQTAAIGIVIDTSSYQTSGQCNLHDLQFGSVYSAISSTGGTGYAINSSLKDIKVGNYSGTAISLTAGTTWDLSQIFIQNLYPGTGGVTVTNIVKAGVQLTLTTSGTFPTGLKSNSFVYLYNVDPGYTKYFVVKSTGVNTVVVDFAVDPGVGPVITTGTLLVIGADAAGPAIYLGDGFEGSLNSVDIEASCCPNGTMLETFGDSVNISQLHIEWVMSTGATWYPIKHSGGALNINSLTVLNSGVQSGGTGYIIYKTGNAGSTIVNSFGIRDIATTGATVSFAGRSVATLSSVILNEVTDLGTVRANATSAIAFGTAKQLMKSTQVRAINSESLTASSGTQIGTQQDLTVNQSGTAAYTGWQYDVTETATGSGSKLPWKLTVGGGTIASITNAGALALTSSISSAPTAATVSSTFGRTGTTDSCFVLGGYGATAIDTRMSLSVSSIQTGDNTAFTSGKTFSINTGSQNSNTRIGSGAAGVGLRVGGSATTIISKINFGVATLVAGTVTVANTDITVNSRIFVTRHTDGGALGTSYSITRVAATSFTITSTSATETSIISWLQFEP